MKVLEELHVKSLRVISQQMKKFYSQKKKVRIYHGSTTSTRAQNFKKDEIIDVSALNRVIEINVEKKYVIVEPNCPMDKLFKATIALGFVLPVVMEFPGITVGGAIQGVAGENSSFKWGFFHETCLEYEMVLGNGDIVTASAHKNPELFWGVAGSYGSLAVTTKIKIKIIPAKKYIKLTYLRTNNFSDGINLILEKIKTSFDFVDAIFFSKTLGTVMVGIFSDKEELPVQRFQRIIDDWFYVHAEKITKKYKSFTELIPIEDYLFRHNRGTYWVGKYPFEKLRIPFNRLTRFLFDPILNARTLMRLLQSINVSQRHFLQDFVLPIETTVAFLDYIVKRLGIYPLYICPTITKVNKDKLSPTNLGKLGIVIDVGVWGHVALDYEKFVELNREVENETKKHKGRKWLYAHQYYTKDEFWEIYDLHWYQKLRKKCFATNVLPDVYEKTRVKEKYTVSIWHGMLDIIKSPFKISVG